MSVFDNAAFDAHEEVVFSHDADTGLLAIIAIHSTVRGPAAGGCRFWQYATSDAALYDVLRLSRGMSYKNAMADLPLGGGKAVILKPDHIEDHPRFFARFGAFVETLGGRYITAEDMGMTETIMAMISTATRHVAGLPADGYVAGGDPSPTTAMGIFAGIRAALQHRFGDPDLRAKTIAIQGVGNVGYKLAQLLHRSGARLVLADPDQQRLERARQEFDAECADLETIVSSDVDVFAPCATGAILNENSIPGIRAAIVAGGANNQLATDADGDRLHARGILYAPDYVINAGGIISVSCEYAGGYSAADVVEKVQAIGPRLARLFAESESSGRATHRIADEMAQKLIGR